MNKKQKINKSSRVCIYIILKKFYIIIIIVYIYIKCINRIELKYQTLYYITLHIFPHF